MSSIITLGGDIVQDHDRLATLALPAKLVNDSLSSKLFGKLQFKKSSYYSLDREKFGIYGHLESWTSKLAVFYGENSYIDLDRMRHSRLSICRGSSKVEEFGNIGIYSTNRIVMIHLATGDVGYVDLGGASGTEFVNCKTIAHLLLLTIPGGMEVAERIRRGEY